MSLQVVRVGESLREKRGKRWVRVEEGREEEGAGAARLFLEAQTLKATEEVSSASTRGEAAEKTTKEVAVGRSTEKDAEESVAAEEAAEKAVMNDGVELVELSSGEGGREKCRKTRKGEEGTPLVCCAVVLAH